MILAVQGLVLFKIDEEEWTLDLRSGKGKVSKGGAGSDKPDLTLTISDDNFVKLVMGKMGPQQVVLLQQCSIQAYQMYIMGLPNALCDTCNMTLFWITHAEVAGDQLDIIVGTSLLHA